MTNSSELFNSIISEIADKVWANYTLDDISAELFLEDAELGADEARGILASIFNSRLIIDGATMAEVYEDLESDGAGAQEAIFRMTQEILAEGKMSQSELISEWVSSAMRYHCYEPWEQIFQVAEFCNQNNDLPELTKTTFGKTVSYLYDGYAVEEETA